MKIGNRRFIEQEALRQGWTVQPVIPATAILATRAGGWRVAVTVRSGRLIRGHIIRPDDSTSTFEYHTPDKLTLVWSWLDEPNR
jgi:hypothetical protein